MIHASIGWILDIPLNKKRTSTLVSWRYLIIWDKLFSIITIKYKI